MISQYRIAGIDIVIDAPAQLSDGEGFDLYRVPVGPTGDECFYLRIIPDESMPPVDGDVVFEDIMHRVLRAEQGVFHQFRIPNTRGVAAWNWIDNSDHCEVHVAPWSVPYFCTSIGAFNVVGFERVLFRHGKYLFHCSYVDAGGAAILFSAPSGGGKTTQGLLWERFAGAQMINGDRGILEKRGETCLVHGLPIAGSSGVFVNRSLPLRAIFIVRKAPLDRAVPLGHEEAFHALLSEITLNTWNPLFVLGAVDFAMQLAESVPVYRLECTISEEAVRAAQAVL